MKKLLSVLLALTLLLGCTVTMTTAAVAEKKENSTDETVSVACTASVDETVTVEVPKAGAKSNSTKTVYAGQTLKLKTSSKGTVKWTSSDKSVVEIKGKNKAVAKKAGTVTLKGNDGSKKYQVNLTVNAVMKASKKDVTVKKGGRTYVTFTFKQYGTLTFNVKNPQIVQPKWAESWKGNTIKLYLSGLKAGTTTVTVTNSYNSEKIKIKVTVEKSKSTSTTKYRALLVGNSNYSQNALPDHKWNVVAMKGMLTQSLKTKYSVTAKYDQTASQILNAIKTTFAGAKSNDVSLFYFGGHGCQYDGTLCGISGYVYPYQLRDALLAVPGKVIVILDCCHSGSMITANGETMTEEADAADFNRKVVSAFSGYDIMFEETGEGLENTGELRQSKFIVLTACQKYEESWNWWYYGSWADQSFATFTKTMFNGMGLNWSSGTIRTSSAPCDTNGNRVVTLYEAYKYIRAHATELNREMGGSNVQNCMYYGSDSYKLFSLK